MTADLDLLLEEVLFSFFNSLQLKTKSKAFYAFLRKRLGKNEKEIITEQVKCDFCIEVFLSEHSSLSPKGDGADSAAGPELFASAG